MCWYAQSQQGRWETFSFSRILQLRSSSSLPFIAYSHRLRKASPHTHRQKHLQHRSLPPHTVAASLPAAGIHSSDISARHKLNWKPLTAWGQPEREMEINYSVWFGEEARNSDWVHEQQLRPCMCLYMYMFMCKCMSGCMHVFMMCWFYLMCMFFFSYFPKSSTNKAAKWRHTHRQLC